MTPAELRAVWLATMTEDELQATIADAARLGGWARAHFPPSRSHRGGHLTAGAYEAVRGWPDLILVRDRVLVLELKSARGTVRPEQAEWLRVWRVALEALGADPADVRVVRPADLDALVTELTTPPRPGAYPEAAIAHRHRLDRYAEALERIAASGAYPEAAIAEEALADDEGAA